MVAIPFPLSSGGEIDGERRAQDSPGRLLNVFAQRNLPGAPSEAKWKRSAMITELSPNNVAEIHCRGMLFVGSQFSGPVMFAVFNNAIYITDSIGTNAFKTGVIPGTGPVTIAFNNRSPTPNVVVVGNSGSAYEVFYNPAVAPTAYPDTDLSSLVNSVSSHNGYFLFTAFDGTIQASDLNSTAINSLSFTTARGQLTRGVSFLNDFIAFGKDFFEIYRDVGTAPFPLAFVDRVPCGLAGRFAVSGHEAGGPGVLIWVADDDSVVQYQGSAQPKTISIDPVVRDIRQANRETLEAYTYTNDSHSFWVLTNPDGWTWEYNITEGLWNQRSSTDRNDWRVSAIARLSGTVQTFWMVGDRATGLLGKINPDAFKEYGEETESLIESGIVPAFPEKTGVPRADFNVVTNVGNAESVDPNISDPEISISWSNDGGFIYKTPVTRGLGTQNSRRDKVTVLRVGMARGPGKRFRLSITDPVNFTLLGGDMDLQDRGKQ